MKTAPAQLEFFSVSTRTPGQTPAVDARGLVTREIDSHHHSRLLAMLWVCLTIFINPSMAGSLDQARRMHDRLVGVPPQPQVLSSMQMQIDAGDPIQAAYEAMDNAAFYNSRLKYFVTPWTNEADNVFAELNDYTALVIGIVRDDIPFNQVLTTDRVYVGAPGVVSTPYSHTDNEHYQELERQRIDLSDPQKFIGVSQSGLPDSQLTTADTAGVITTRAAGEAFFKGGTNRRMTRFLLRNYLCRDLEQMNDITRPVDRIRQDVSRSPGGDSSLFLNSCSGCHSGLDAMSQAFAYLEYDQDLDRVVHTPGQVQPKYLINANNFRFGFVTTDNRWDNYWRQGQNGVLGWSNSAGGGYGAKSLGQEIANSRAFSVCQVEKVFEQICFRRPSSASDRNNIERIADVFESDNFSLKRVFAETAVVCMGE